MDLDEDGQEIIARGHWTQAANGDTTYYPGHVRPRRLVGEPYEGWQETAPLLGEDEDGELDPGQDAAPENAAREDPAPEDPGDAFWDHPDAPARGDLRGGYRIRSEITWGRARADYLAGDSAPSICDRYDLSLGAFRSRAAREGWRRSDGEADLCNDSPLPTERADPDPDPGADCGADPGADAAPDLDRMAADVMVRAQRAIARGRAAEAATWLRVHRQLTRLAPPPPAPAAAPPPGPPPAPDPLDLLDRKMKAVGEVARAAAGLDPDNAHGQAAISQLLDQLKALPVSDPVADPAPDPVPISDDSDCEFSPATEAEPPPPDG